ncbi:hypothetical protein GQ457_06G021180 [Hibiscus cannabinus]
MEAILPTDIIQRIATIPTPSDDDVLDIPVWRWDAKHQFSMRSAYDVFTQEMELSRNEIWQHIWKVQVPQRIRVFIWLVYHDRLFTNVERVRGHLASSELCELCGRDREDLEHVLRSCIMARNVWLLAIPTETRHIFFNLPFMDWVYKNLFDHSFMVTELNWSTRFAVLCWLIWKRRCSLLFDPDVSYIDDILTRGNRLVAECNHAVAALVPIPHRLDVQPRWVAPPHGSVKLNVDAAVFPTDHTAGVGGVIRDENGCWILGFARFVGRCDVLIAELWAIYDGLVQAWNTGFSSVKLESDCLEATCIITSQSDALTSSALVASIKELLSRAWTIVVRHVPRLSNSVANRLAARGRGLGVTQSLFYRLSVDMVSLM